jgi:hypothetical protein
MAENTTVSALVLHITQKAVLIVPNEMDEKVWVPVSLIENADELVTDGDTLQDLHIAKWFCDKEGIK